MEPTTDEAPRTQPRAWVVRAGKEARYASHNLKHDVVSISFQEYGDVDIERFADRSAFGDHLVEIAQNAQSLAGASEQKIRLHRDGLWRFAKAIHVGDYVIMPHSESGFYLTATLLGAELHVMGQHKFVLEGGCGVQQANDHKDTGAVEVVLGPANDVEAICEFIEARFRATCEVDSARGVVTVTPSGSHEPKAFARMAIGRIVGPYFYDASQHPETARRRAVKWLQRGLHRGVANEDLRTLLNQRVTVFELAKHDAPYRFEQMGINGIDPGARKSVDAVESSIVPTSQTLGERLEQAAKELLCDVSELQNVLALLQDKGQVILYGPPGTGKTYFAKALAKAIAPEAQARPLVQFHPAYSYEEFFEGYRPVVDDSNQMTYELQAGPLARVAERAANNPTQHVMVIDEINRANLPRVLGELLFLLEYRNESIAAMYRGEFKLPPNLWFIGTMNTADRSIALIDAAMRRRFHFVPFFPEREPTKSLLRKWCAKHAPDQGWIADLVSAVNVELEQELGGEHLQIGPSHFMKTNLNRGGFSRIWRYNIEPFIEDQLFGQPDKIARFRLDEVCRRYGPDVALRDALPEKPPTFATFPTEFSPPTRKSTAGRQNNDARVAGQEIYDTHKNGTSPYTWMGRNRGINGPELREDLRSGGWKTWRYEVRYEARHARNWFSIEEFVALVDRQLEANEESLHNPDN